ncbi:restriction endonuclease subunit S [Helicobacter sp. 23-1044]
MVFNPAQISVNIANLESEFIAQGGKWEEFRLIDMFNYKRGTRLVKNARIKGDLPLLTAGEFNQGVKEFISNQNQQIFSNAITIDMFCNSFVHIENFCCDDNILVLNPKEPMSKYHLRFISTIINKDKSKYGYGKQYRMGSLENHKIPLPTIEGKIAFDFMESYIKELEAEQIRELEAYLEVTGLKDYELDAQEREALAIFASLCHTDSALYHNKSICHTDPEQSEGEVSQKSTNRDSSLVLRQAQNDKNTESRNDTLNIHWRDFTIGELFEVSKSKKKFNANTLTFNGKYPYIARGAGNNGIRGYIDKDIQYLNEANTISFGQDTATMFYQPNPYFTGDKIKIFKPKILKFDKYIAHFIIPTLKRAFSNFSWGSSSYKESVLENMTILLPVNQNNEIAFDFMEKFISAVQKEVIKSVVLWNQKRTNATKAIVENR